MTWAINVIKIDEVNDHPNADRLDIATVEGTPVIIRKGEYKPGDKAVYVPIDSIVPDNDSFSFLKGHRRIKAKKLRGIFSMGMLVTANTEWEIGQDVQAELEIEKYDPIAVIEHTMANNAEVFTGNIIKYDIDNLRKYLSYFEPNEEVFITEKLHGACSRFVYKDNRMWCGSRNQFIKYEKTDMWWRLSAKYDLENKLKEIPEIAVYGESYGYVQDLKYGAEKGQVSFAAFDVLDTKTMKWYNVQDFLDLMKDLDIPTVPEIYRGPLPDKNILFAMAEGETQIDGATHMREGIVVKPMIDRKDYRFNRVIYKLPGESYLLRKQK